MIECDICPFSKSELAIKTWTAEVCDQIDECAAVLKSEGQTIPHPCFKLHGVLLRPTRKGEVICRGHQKWIDRNSE